jgi:hypothetical protein
MPASTKPIRVSVKWENGHWNVVLGEIGEIRAGALAELYIGRACFIDQTLANRWTAKRKIAVLPQGAELRVALTVASELKAPYKSLLLDPSATPYDHTPTISIDTRFVSIHLMGPTEAQRVRKIESGGLRLCLEGMDPKRIESGLVELQGLSAEKPVDSLNQAFTRLSELFEPWRTSHTGNIYDRIYYRESDGRWYPCVASATSGQMASAKMRDFELLRAPRRRSEVDEQTRTSTIYGGTETRDSTRGGSARRDGERGVPAARFGGLGILSVAGGGPGRLGGRAEARCPA